MHEQFFGVLHTDHELFRDLLRQLSGTTGSDLKKREKLFVHFKQQITLHTKAEEKAFYTRLKEARGCYRNVLESIEEHHVIELLLNELDQISIEADQWRAKFGVCKELVEHHIREEEEEIFECARKALRSRRMLTILVEFRKERKA